MTLRDALNRLGGGKDVAAKRPSMRGYVYKAPAAEEEAADRIVLRLADGTERVFGEDGISLTAELFDAIVLADDWSLASREALEKARAGEGTM